MFTASEIISITIAVIGWTVVVIGGVVRYVRAENRKLLDTTLESMRFQLRSEMQTIRADFYRDFHKVDRG